MIELSIPADFFIKQTDASLCFLLWGKKRLAFPLRWMKNCSPTQADPITFQYPKWFIEKHKIRSLVADEELRSFYFPLKRDLKKEASTPLLNQVSLIPTEKAVDSEARVYTVWPGTRKGGKTEATTVLRDEDIPF